MRNILFISLAVSCLQVILGEPGYQQVALKMHNQHRSDHRTTALALDKQLNTMAVKCAKYYAKKKTIDHSCPYKKGGENLWLGVGGDWSESEIAESSVTDWYNEEKQYDYNNPGYADETAHFTQLVWKSSKKFGFGVAKVNGYSVGVALYSPQGNMQGLFSSNVLEPSLF